MKVLLIKDVDNLGYAGEIKNVAPGFGRNYLIPRGLVEKATPSAVKRANVWRDRASARREEMQAEYAALSKRIAATSLTFYAKAGDTGKLYGSVTMAEVADKLNETLGTDIDRRKMVGGALRELGDYKIRIKLDGTFHPEVAVSVEPEENIPVVEVAEEAEVEEAEEGSAETEAEAAPEAEAEAQAAPEAEPATAE